MAKKTKAGLPKTIMGISVPKQFRKAGWLQDLIHSDTGRKILADALIAGAGAVAAVLVNHRPGSDEGVRTKDAIVDKAAVGKRRAKKTAKDSLDAVVRISQEAAPAKTKRRRRSTAGNGPAVGGLAPQAE